MTENRIAEIIVDACFKIHTILGPGLLESVYETVLAHELRSRGLSVVRQQCLPIVYEGITLDEGFRADLIVQDLVIVELKSIETILPVHKKQLNTYLFFPQSRKAAKKSKNGYAISNRFMPFFASLRLKRAARAGVR